MPKPIDPTATFLKWKDLEDGYWLARRRNLSPTTQVGYRWVFREFGKFIGDRLVLDITPDDINAFLDAQEKRGISKRTLSDRWVPLSSIWTWANTVFGVPQIVHEVERQGFKDRDIIPMTHDEIKALLRAAEWEAPWTGRAGKPTRSRRPTAKRDRAMILTLLDCGVRASELCAFTVADYTPDTGRLHVRHGKGDKDRTVYVGESARLAIWQYRLSGAPRPKDPLFATRNNTHISRHSLGDMLNVIARNAKVSHVHPHRFRHTFAINFLRNGGNVFELQKLLGHESLHMVRRYVAIAESDIEAAHSKASPADNWRL